MLAFGLTRRQNHQPPPYRPPPEDDDDEDDEEEKTPAPRFGQKIEFHQSIELPQEYGRPIRLQLEADQWNRQYLYDEMVDEEEGEMPHWAQPNKEEFLEHLLEDDDDDEEDETEDILFAPRIGHKHIQHGIFSPTPLFWEIIDNFGYAWRDFKTWTLALPLEEHERPFVSFRRANTEAPYWAATAGATSAFSVLAARSMGSYMNEVYRMAVIASRIGLKDESGRLRNLQMPLMPKDGPLLTRLSALLPKPRTMLASFFYPLLQSPLLPFAGTLQSAVVHVPYQAIKFSFYDTLQEVFSISTNRFSNFFTAFLGGYSSGAVASALTHPLHVAEQSAIASYENPLRFGEAAANLYRAESWYSFMDGIRSRMMYNGFLEGFSFGFYTYFKNKHPKDESFVRHFLAGSYAGICASTLMLPFDYINYRVAFYWPPAIDALSNEPIDEYSGSYDAWQKIRAGKHGGYWGFASRTLMRVLKPAPVIGLQFALFEEVRSLIQRRREQTLRGLPPSGPLELREQRNKPEPMVQRAPVKETVVREQETPSVPYFSATPVAETPLGRAPHLEGVFQMGDAAFESEDVKQ